MMDKELLAERVEEVLTQAGFSTSDRCYLRPRSFDLAALLRKLVDDHRKEAQSKQQTLVIAAPSMCVTSGHPGLLDLAVRNLITNAIGHAPSGATIEVRLKGIPAVVEVRDNGAAQSGTVDFGTNLLGLGFGHRFIREVARSHNGAFRATGPDSDGWRTYAIELGRNLTAQEQPSRSVDAVAERRLAHAASEA